MFLVITTYDEGAVKVAVNFDNVKEFRPFAASPGDESWRSFGRTELTLRDGSSYIIRETPAKLVTALGAVIP